MGNNDCTTYAAGTKQGSTGMHTEGGIITDNRSMVLLLWASVGLDSRHSTATGIGAFFSNDESPVIEQNTSCHHQIFFFCIPCPLCLSYCTLPNTFRHTVTIGVAAFQLGRLKFKLSSFINYTSCRDKRCLLLDIR